MGRTIDAKQQRVANHSRQYSQATQPFMNSLEKPPVAARAQAYARPGYGRLENNPLYKDGFNSTSFALNNPDSKMAKQLGLDQHGLNEDEKKDVAKIVGTVSAYRPREGGGIGGFFNMIIEMIMSIFQSPEEKRENAVKKAKEAAIKVAANTYIALEKNGYDKLAESVSGVKKEMNQDGTASFVPVRDDQGNNTGIYNREVMRATNPKALFIQDAMDAGVAPTPAQSAAKEKIIQQELDNLYKDAGLRAEVKAYRAEREQTRGKNEELQRFTESEKTKAVVERIVERVTNDPEIKASGRFDFGSEKNVAVLRKQIERDIKANHSARFEKAEKDAAQGNAQAAAAAAVSHESQRLPVADASRASQAPVQSLPQTPASEASATR